MSDGVKFSWSGQQTIISLFFPGLSRFLTLVLASARRSRSRDLDTGTRLHEKKMTMYVRGTTGSERGLRSDRGKSRLKRVGTERGWRVKIGRNRLSAHLPSLRLHPLSEGVLCPISSIHDGFFCFSLFAYIRLTWRIHLRFPSGPFRFQ